ncbi:MAG: hypothetical protein M3069_23940 [Chloroflexota bacterium]|nr:hypothetical protein [Chloroflexota bacterium]
MPVWTLDPPSTRHPEGAARATDARLPVQLRALASASRLFSAAAEGKPLPDLVASALAAEPGEMCLVSLADRTGASLRPVAVAHRRPSVGRKLHSIVSAATPTPADAFSHAVLRSGSALRMAISNPSMLRLWLPEVYWPYTDCAAVSGVLAAPLIDREWVFGALLMWRERDQPRFDELDQAYVVSLAQRLALGLVTHPVVSSTPPAALP